MPQCTPTQHNNNNNKKILKGREVPHNLTNIWNLKKTDLIQVDSRIVVMRHWGE
jgi:hypothetical protein